MRTGLHLNDLFFTIQGEGHNAGRRALFVRMPYCNLACSWCDTSFNSFTEYSELEFVRAASAEATRFAVITGGEPTMHKHTARVVELLREIGYVEIAVETNGMFPIPPGITWVTCSPKKDSAFNKPAGLKAYFVHPDTFDRVDEFKYVVDNSFDWNIIERHNVDLLREGQKDAYLYLSPEYNDRQKHVTKILDYLSSHPWWRLSLQTHKWIGVP